MSDVFTATGRRIALPGPITAIDLSDDGERLAVGFAAAGPEPKLWILDARTGEQIGGYASGGIDAVCGAALLPDGTIWFLADRGAAGRDLQVAGPDGLTQLALYTNDAKVARMARAPGGGRVAVCGRAAHVWDTARRAEVAVIAPTHATPVFAAFPDADRLWVSGVEPGRLVEWEVDGPRRIRELPVAFSPHPGHLAVSRDDRRLFSCGYGNDGNALFDTEGTRLHPDLVSDQRGATQRVFLQGDPRFLVWLPFDRVSVLDIDARRLVKAEIPPMEGHSWQTVAAPKAPVIAIARLGNVVDLVRVTALPAALGGTPGARGG